MPDLQFRYQAAANWILTKTVLDPRLHWIQNLSVSNVKQSILLMTSSDALTDPHSEFAALTNETADLAFELVLRELNDLIPWSESDALDMIGILWLGRAHSHPACTVDSAK